MRYHFRSLWISDVHLGTPAARADELLEFLGSVSASRIARFEDQAARYAKLRGYDGVVCGHIHRPGIRDINGIRYANDGDWVEHRTAVAEDWDGRLRLLGWQAGKLTIMDAKDADDAASLAA